MTIFQLVTYTKQACRYCCSNQGCACKKNFHSSCYLPMSTL